MRWICPWMDIDWSQRGGLLRCNLPFIDPPRARLQGMRVDSANEESLVVEVERKEDVLSCCLMCCLAIVPYSVPLVMIGPDYFAIAWRFHRDLEGRVKVEYLRKTSMSESVSLIASNVQLAFLETVEEHSASRDQVVVKRRLALLTEDSTPLRSPWKLDPLGTLDPIVDRINQFIPAETRAASVPPPASIPTAQIMDRAVRAEPLAADGQGAASGTVELRPGIQKMAPSDSTEESSTVAVADSDADWDSVPLTRIVERICLELGELHSTRTLALSVQRACEELHVEQSGIVKLDAIRAARQLGLSPASFGQQEI